MTEEMQNIVEPVIQSELEVTEAVIETAPTNTIKFEELRVGMEFRGRVEKVELYGAWVNIGLDRPAMLHISQMGQSEIRNVQDVVTGAIVENLGLNRGQLRIRPEGGHHGVEPLGGHLHIGIQQHIHIGLDLL